MIGKQERDAEIRTQWIERKNALVARLANMEIGPDRIEVLRDVRELNEKIEGSYSVMISEDISK